MFNDLEQILDSILVAWHRSSPRDLGGDYPPESASCRLYRSSRQYDSENGALDTDRHAQTMEAVDNCLSLMPQPWQTAICINARNLATGVYVWQSGRPGWPKDDVGRAHLVSEARAMAMRFLQSDGLL